MSPLSDAARRSALTRAQIAIGLVLAVVLLALVNYLSYRHFRRLDWTEADVFTISGRTKQVLHGLDRDVTVYLFFSPDDQMYQDVDELLRAYRAESTHLRVRKVDPSTQQSEYEVLANRFGITTMQTQDGSPIATVDVVIEASDKHWTIRRDDLVAANTEASPEEGPVLDVQTERALTGGILQVISGRPTKVCVASGHGEFTLEGAGQRTLATLEDEMRLENVVFESVPVTSRASIPEGCDAVLVLGPQRPYSPDEAAALGAYVDGGGRLLLALDPVLDAQNQVLPSGFETVLRAHGITLGRDFVIETDPGHQLGGEAAELFLVDSFTSHPLVATLRAIGGGFAMHSARSVSVVEDGGAELVAQTSADAYAESDVAALARGGLLQPSDGDLRGPVGLAAVFPAASAEPGAATPRGKLVVIGDTDWLRSELLGQPQLANVDFASAVIGLLGERPALVSIAPRRAHAQALLMPEDGPRSIFVRVVILLPLAFALLGVSVWWSRRS